MSPKAKPRHIRTGMNLKLFKNLTGVPVQFLHGSQNRLTCTFRHQIRLDRRIHDPRTQRLRQDQLIPGLRSKILPELPRIYKTRHTEPILWCIILDRMATGKNRTSLHHLICTTTQDFPEDFHIHILRKRHNIQSRLWSSTHSIYITQRIGRCDLPEIIRIICHRSKKIQCLDQCQIFGNLINGSIIRSVCSNQKIRIRELWQPSKNSRQSPRSYLSCTATVWSQFCQLYFFFHDHFPFPLSPVNPVIHPQHHRGL